MTSTGQRHYLQDDEVQATELESAMQSCIQSYGFERRAQLQVETTEPIATEAQELTSS